MRIIRKVRRALALLGAAAVLACGLSACAGGGPPPEETLIGYTGVTRWALEDCSVELDNDGAGVLTFYLVREEAGETVRTPFQQLPADYGAQLRYPFPSSVGARPFTGVLGHDGFVLEYGLGASSQAVEYYALDGDGTPVLLAACDGLVYELDWDADGDAELLECRYGADGDARVYDWLDDFAPDIPAEVGVGDVNHAAAVALGFIRGGVGVAYAAPEGGHQPGAPLELRCFPRMNDSGTPAGDAVPRDAAVQLAWDDMSYTSPASAYAEDRQPLRPHDPDGMDRDSGRLEWSDYGVDFTLHIPADLSVQGTNDREYWNAWPQGSLELLDALPEGLTEQGGVCTASGLDRYGNPAVPGQADLVYRGWYFPLSDGVHCVRLLWSEDDLETAERIVSTLVLSGDGPIVRTYYDYEKPTSECFGLTGEYAAIFDYLVGERWAQCRESHTLYLPRITCYGTYAEAGRTVYVCYVSESDYHDLTLEKRAVTPGWGGSLMAFSIGYGGPGLPGDAPMVDSARREQDGEGSAQSVRALCGALTNVADCYLGLGAPVHPLWDEMPSSADLPRAYVAATGAPIDTVAIYGMDHVPLADFRDGW